MKIDLFNLKAAAWVLYISGAVVQSVAFNLWFIPLDVAQPMLVKVLLAVTSVAIIWTALYLFGLAEEPS